MKALLAACSVMVLVSSFGALAEDSEAPRSEEEPQVAEVTSVEESFAGHPTFRPGSDEGGAGSAPLIEICGNPEYICDAYCDNFWGACVHGYSSVCWQTGCFSLPPCCH